MEKSKALEDNLYNLSARKDMLNREIKGAFLDVVKAYKEKYGTNEIEFESDYCPCATISRLDKDNADFNIYRIVFDENGEISTMDGNVYYDDEDIFDAQVSDFYDIDYLDLAMSIVKQIKCGRFTTA